MNRNIEKIKTTILNRVRFHAPICFDAGIDKTILFRNGINPNLPVFKYDKTINRDIIKAVELAGYEEKFNFVVSLHNVDKKYLRSLSKLQYVVLYNENTSPAEFVSMINKLNVNYPVDCNYSLKFQNKFFKFCDNIINPAYKEFSLEKSGDYFGVYYEYKEFVLNGQNIYFKIKNTTNIDKKLSISLNIPLERGYYIFKRKNNSVEICNLLNIEKKVFSFICPHAQISFSAIDGLENSCFATIHLVLNFVLKKGEDRGFYFLMSNKKCPLKRISDIEKLYDISICECKKIFDVRVKTANFKFDQYFNTLLPKKIWINWSNSFFDEKLIEKYLMLKRLFLKGENKHTFVPFKEIGLKEIGVFNGEYYKKILIGFGREKFVQVGVIKYINSTTLEKRELSKKDPIYISFIA